MSCVNRQSPDASLDDGMFPKIGRCEEFGGSVKDLWTRFFDLQDRMEKAQVRTLHFARSLARSLVRVPQSIRSSIRSRL